LREILGLVRAPGQPQQIPVDAGVVLPEEPMAGLRVADPELLNEPGIRGWLNWMVIWIFQKAIPRAHAATPGEKAAAARCCLVRPSTRE
jgi:hypothetical protein